MDRTKTARLIALLHAQRAEAEHRARHPRDSHEWVDSSARLDALNDRIMHVDALGPINRDRDDLRVDLDSRPADDAPFRQDVVDSVRHGMVVTTRERLADSTLDRVDASAERTARTRALIACAEDQLHDQYPHASLAESGTSQRGVLHLRADRDGRVA
jgi:hypothetical protein